jgi:hypothetical protein
MIRQAKPTIKSAKGENIIMDGFLKILGPIKAASNPSTTIILNGSKSICQRTFFPLLSRLYNHNDISISVIHNFALNGWHKQQGISRNEKSNELIPCLLDALVTPVLSSL